MGKREITGYIGDMTQLDMVLDARLVLTRDGGTPAEWAANSMLIERYSKGAWKAEGTAPAVRVTGTPIPADTDARPAEWQRPTGNGSGNGSGGRKSNAVTDGQRALLVKLIEANITDDATRATMIASIDTLTKTSCRPIIEGLIKMDRAREDAERTAARTAPARKTPAQLDATLPRVPDGRYRVGGRNVKVDNPQHGQWAGRVFLTDLDDEGHKIDAIRAHADKLHLLTAIAADVYACLIEFGKATGACGKCDTHLEDPESVARGIGPYCEADALGIPVSQVYRERKANPVATINQPPTAPAPAATQTPAAAPAPAAQTPATPEAAPAADALTGLTADAVDAMTFPQAMTVAKAIKLPGRGTARLPQLRDGIKAALALAA